MDFVIFVLVGYLLGSVPFGLISGWATKHVDIREYGSGNTGMTNVMRTVSVPVGILVLLLDMGKAVAVVVLARIFTDSFGVETAAAIAVLIGHNWSVFLGFRGGRGTATGWGSLIILLPVSGLAATAVGLPIVAFTRYMSLASVVSTIVGVGTMIGLSISGYAPSEYIWFGIIGGAIVVGRHKDNIQRLLKGEERKVGQPAEATS